ncbi:unnamed protein product [Paramecium sonneborni]|uniref:Cyclin-Q n=1 Tax=Paramecium sonneborni TaxID=65129 RepID=A0A8S1KNM7_9CILI|nr:unnamed protein product [Paramecium sonneborni]
MLILSSFKNNRLNQCLNHSQYDETQLKFQYWFWLRQKEEIEKKIFKNQLLMWYHKKKKESINNMIQYLNISQFELSNKKGIFQLNNKSDKKYLKYIVQQQFIKQRKLMSSKSHDRHKILSLEQNVGLTKEQYEKKYLFHRLKERFLHSQDLSLETITPEGHENIYIPMDIQSPTQADGLSYEDEQALRMHGAQICFQACNHLKLPLTTAITSLVIFHRFFAKNSFVDFDYREISMASLYLAGKVEETLLKTWYIAGAFSSVFQKQKQAPLDIIIKQEKLILKELGFELFRVSDHPHKFIESFYHFIKIDKQVAQKAWYYLNDSYMTDLCVHFPPQVIAAGALYLALRVCNHPMPTQPWWILLEATLVQIEQVAATIYNIYEFEKMDFRQARRILAKANRVAYVIQHSEIYGIPEKIERPLETKKSNSQLLIQQTSQLPQQNQQESIQNNKEKQEPSPNNKDKKSIKKKSKSKEKKSKDKKNKSEKKKNKEKDKDKDKEKKKEDKKKKKKSRSRSKSNDKKLSKKQKKKEKEKEKEREKEREREREKEKEKENEKEKEKEKEKDKEIIENIKEKDNQKNDQEKSSEDQNSKKEQDQYLDRGMIKSNMEIENENEQTKNNKNNQQQNLKSNEQIRDDNIHQNLQTFQESQFQAQQTNQDDQQQNIVPIDDQSKVQLPLQSKQDFIAQMKALLKTQQLQKIDDIEKKDNKVENNQIEKQSPEQDSEEDQQLNAIKLKILAKKRNEQ